MTTDQLKDHLEFYAELGIDGIRRDPEWHTRVDAPRADAQSSVTAAAAEHSAPGVAAEPLGRHERIERAERTEQVERPEQLERPEQPEQPERSEPIPVFASAADALAALRVDIGPQCTRCKLHTLGRQQVVFGVGNPGADLMFVGEAPGADEDVQGEPFVGRAGQLLTKIIEAIGLTRGDVYIANVIKCRPPGNRNPEPDEVERCEPFLFRQIDTVKPKIIVALGKFAAQSLLRTTEPITKIRGREFTYRDSILMPTYHPAYLLRNPSAKRDVWEDMKRVREILSGPQG